MKKIIFTILVFISCFSFISFVNAENFCKINVQITFGSNVDVDKIGDIRVNLNDEYNEEYKVKLTRKEGYKGVIENVPAGRNIVYEYTDIGNDTTGSYNDTSKLSGFCGAERDLNLVVNIEYKKQNPTDPNVHLDEAFMESIRGTTTTRVTDPNSKTTETTTTEVVKYDDEGNIIIDDDDDDENVNNETTSATTNADGLTDEEVKKKKKEEEELAKKNSIIAKVLFGAIGIAVLIALVIAGVKIANANK